MALLATAASSRTSVPSLIPDETLHATDGAYRDGLFIGHLDRSHNQRHHLAAGRWSNAADRHAEDLRNSPCLAWVVRATDAAQSE